jgi:DNA-binding NtrC family response regulator
MNVSRFWTIYQNTKVQPNKRIKEKKDMIKIPTKVLLVDDEKDFIEMLSLRLKEVGEKITVAYSGQEALDTLEQADIDVVILDIKMPGMDGIETLREIKKQFPLVEVIMLTGHGSTETAVEGMKLGAFDYLMKPADFDDLTLKLEGARKRKDEQQERIRKAEAKLLLRKSGGAF